MQSITSNVPTSTMGSYSTEIDELERWIKEQGGVEMSSYTRERLRAVGEYGMPKTGISRRLQNIVRAAKRTVAPDFAPFGGDL